MCVCVCVTIKCIFNIIAPRSGANQLVENSLDVNVFIFLEK